MLYTVKGYTEFGDKRYVQFSKYNPVIKTKTGYRANDCVVFKTEKEAFKFMNNFLNSELRKNKDVDWFIEPLNIKYMWNEGKHKYAVTAREVMTIYGKAYRRHIEEVFC